MVKGVADAKHGKGLPKGEANENERRGHTETSYRRLNKRPLNNYDWSRHGLNFEIVRGKVVPLGSQEKSMYFRYLDALKNIDFKTYKDGASNQQNTYAALIFSGSTAHMQRIAFGDQKVDYTRNPEQWRNWGVTRSKAIEEWALDTYKFACEMYGEENILGFDVHLDETAPHIHCKVVPTAIKQQRGNISGYHKVDADGNPVTYQKGKHVGEVIKISDKKYAELSEEKKKEYRPNVRGTVRTISYASFFGRTLTERAEKLSELHTKYYESVGKKWGLERGDVIANLPEEERRKRRHRTKEEADREKKAKMAREKAEREASEAIKAKDAAVREKDTAIEQKESALKEVVRQQSEISNNTVIIKNQDRLICEQKTELQKAVDDTAQARRDKDVAVKEMNDAVRARNEALEERNTAIDVAELQRRKIDEQEDTISSNSVIIYLQEKEKTALLEDLTVMSTAKKITSQHVDSYVKALADLEFIVPRNVREKLSSPLREHPRIFNSNPPLTVKELEKIADELVMAAEKKSWTTGRLLSAFKDIRTDVETILFSVVDKAQREGIMRANKEMYKDYRSQLADSAQKTVKLKEFQRSGITKESYEELTNERNEAQETAKRMPEMEKTLEYAWPGITKAKNVLTDPALDEKYMSEEQKNDILSFLRKDPKIRLNDIKHLFNYACSYRDISILTLAEAIELATEDIIKGLTEKGYDLVKEATALVGDVANELEISVEEASSSAASAAVCLMNDYLTGAYIVSQGCGGGGDTGGWRGKRDDEDDQRFFGRCLMGAVKMMKPKQKQLGNRL